MPSRAPRTLLVYPLPAIVVAVGWMRLETPFSAAWRVGALLVLALLPALVRDLRVRIAAAVVATLVAFRLALGVSPLDAHPLDGRHDFFGPLFDRFGNGFVDFYDFALPIDPRLHPWMHGVLLLAAFAFCLLLGLAIATRRIVLAASALVVGAGWPATLLQDQHDLRRGVIVLLALLVVLAGLGGARAGTLRRALPVAAAVVALAALASGSPAVAKTELLRWQAWDLYTRPAKPVGVRFVWNSQYNGISFPKKVTTVLKIKAPSTSRYWRATTLDVFTNDHWIDGPASLASFSAPDALEPAAASEPKHQVEATVSVEALRDTFLVGASDPVRFDPKGLPVLYFGDGDIAVLPHGLERGMTYREWSYSPRPTARQLERSKPIYPPLARARYLDVLSGAGAPPYTLGSSAMIVPAFGVNGRDVLMRPILDGLARTRYAPYTGLYAQAKAVAGAARTPYAATVALESWFRQTGGFTYSEHPPVAGSAPPLVTFALQTKTGYCQHFAGAMALMLRYLGIPARVAVGFLSGDYDSGKGVWTVTDHDAHAWVEVWFRGYGWLPFDPTPGRGSLSAAYSTSSPHFDLSALGRLLAPSAAAKGEDVYDLKQEGDLAERNVKRNGQSNADVPRGVHVVPAGARRAGTSLLLVLALLVLGVAAAIALVKTARRRARYFTRDPRRLAAACRLELVEFLSDQRLAPPPSATVVELGELARKELAVDPKRFVAAVGAARYGPPRESARAARRARRELRELERQLRARLTPAERLRGLLSLRSLGFSG